MPVCTRCGHESAVDFKFCPECGAPPGLTTVERRKTVTVLFCDLVGSTALGDRTDPEPLREAMGRYHAEVRAILERHGGTVEKFIGDAAMAVFGIPQAHENDALRAVRAAAEIREAIARLALEARIGINTGEVVTGEGETLVTGDAVNVAARLEQAASPGDVLLGAHTHHLVRDSVRAEPIEALELKGKATPVPAYRLLESLPEMPAFTRPIDAPFVGRKHELEALERTVAGAVSRRTPRLATVVGPPGIGKSRLARELIQRSEASVVVGRCLSYGEGITYWPLAEVVSQVGEVGAALGDDGDAELAASRIAAALGTAETPASSDEIAWGFRRLFESLARRKPLIVVLDDIHWAEPTLLDLIEYVSTFAQDAPLLLLCIARPDLFELRPSWSTPKPNAKLVMLEPLSGQDTETLVEELHAVPDRTRARIVEAAEGNPLFVEQLVAMQADSANGELTIPPTIQALLAARIDRLEPEERAVIERASIEGRLFHRGSVAALMPEQARPRFGTHLMTLVRKELIRPDRASVPGDDGFRFGHILIRDAAYDSVPKRLRAELHERFAGWLESRLGDGAAGEILGYHLEQAYRYRVELGSDDEDARALARRAGRLLAEAGRRAYRRSDASAASSLLARAAELLSMGDPELPAALALLGLSTFEAGDVARALETLRTAQRAAAAAGQRSVELRARMDEINLLLNSSRQDAAPFLAEAQAAIAELQHLGDEEALSRAWRVVAAVASAHAKYALMQEASARRLAIVRKAGLRREAKGATALLLTAMALGPTRVEDAVARAEQALADFPEERVGESTLALLYAFAGRIDEAEQAIGRIRRKQLDLGQHVGYAGLSMYVGWIALLAGQPERAEHELRAAAELLEKAGEQSARSTVAAVLAEVLYRLGRDEEAEEWTRRSEHATPQDDALSQALWRSTRAKVLASEGEADAALRLSTEAVAWARGTDALPLLGDCLLGRAEVLQLLGRAGEAQRVLVEALAVYERKGIIPSAERARALLAGTATPDGS